MGSPPRAEGGLDRENQLRQSPGWLGATVRSWLGSRTRRFKPDVVRPPTLVAGPVADKKVLLPCAHDCQVRERK